MQPAPTAKPAVLITHTEANDWCANASSATPLPLSFHPTNINTKLPTRLPTDLPKVHDISKPAHSTDISELISKTLKQETAIPDEILVKATIGKFGLMHPRMQALDHEAADSRFLIYSFRYKFFNIGVVCRFRDVIHNRFFGRLFGR